MADGREVQYQTVYYRNGNPIPARNDGSQMAWERVLDDSGTAEITHVVGNLNDDQWHGRLEPHADTVGIFRNGEPAWYGWISNVKYQRNRTTVYAYDALGWLARRVVRSNLSYAGADATTIAEGIWDDAVGSSGDVTVAKDFRASGILLDRTYGAAEYRLAWPLFKELCDTAIDATVLGQLVLAGNLEFLGVIDLTPRDIQGDIEVTKDGFSHATRQIVRGGNGVIGDKSLTPAERSPYPLVEMVTEDSNIEDQAGADESAQTRLDASGIVPRRVIVPEGSKLIDCSDHLFRRLVPGIMVNFSTVGQMQYEAVETMRLTKLKVEVSGGKESIMPTLSPLGSSNSVA